MIDLSSWPEGSRLILRKERPHRGPRPPRQLRSARPWHRPGTVTAIIDMARLHDHAASTEPRSNKGARATAHKPG